MTGTVPDGKFGDKALGFDDPTRLPKSEAEREAWQEANRAWWERRPMRYDWNDLLTSDAATGNFFREIDERFLSSVEKFLPSHGTPFDALIPFDKLGDKDVLEIGVGHGSVAQFLALHARSYTGIDLTEEAKGESDEELDSQGIKILVDMKSMLYLNGTEIDFRDEVMASGFVFKNPNATSSCGCGSSFSA